MASHLSGPLKKGPVQPYVQLPDQICNSPYCQPYNSHNVSSENLVLDQLIIPKLILFFILMIYLVDNVLIFLWGEILSWSLMRVKGLKRTVLNLPNLTLWLWLSFPAYTSNTFIGVYACRHKLSLMCKLTRLWLWNINWMFLLFYMICYSW